MMETIEIAPYRDLCTDCGVSRTKQPKRCATACQFIQPNYPQFEIASHGRAREMENSDQVFFGTYLQMYRASLKKPLQGAQWTGIITRLCELLLERGMVDAIITMSSDPEDQWRPQPVIITQAQDMQGCRGRSEEHTSELQSH